MNKNTDPAFQVGNLVKSDLSTSVERSGVRCFPGDLTKEKWALEPERVFLCQEIEPDIIGFIIDTVSINPFIAKGKNIDSSAGMRNILLLKIITVVAGQVTNFWVFCDDFFPLPQEP